VDGWMDGWMDGRMDGRMGGRMGGWADKTSITELLDQQKCSNIVNKLLNQVTTTFKTIVM
jgi:hypothetical protein